MNRLSAHLDRGWELVAQGDLAGAMASAEQTLELDSESPDAHNLIGFIHAANGNVEVALEHYRQAIDIDDNHIEAILNAVELLINPLGEFDEALDLLDQALEASETSDEIADTTILKVDVLIAQGERDKAISVLHSLPEGPYENEGLDFLIGRSYFDLGLIEEAAPFIERSIAVANPPSDSHYYLGLLREDQGRRDEAIVSLLQARHLDEHVPAPTWAPSLRRFEQLVQEALRQLPEDLQKHLDGVLVLVTRLPGLEVVAEGVDPRAPLLFDAETQGPNGAVTPARVFVYQSNIERLVRQPMSLAEDLLEILTREIELSISRKDGAPDAN